MRQALLREQVLTFFFDPY